MRRITLWVVCLAMAGLTACREAPTTNPAEPVAQAAPTTPPEVAQVAQSLLGSDAEVLTFGDLARTGKSQMLAINRLPRTPQGVVPGILLTRAVVAEQDGERWKELFRCDEYLKNREGFLGGTPIAPVTGWRLRYEQETEKGLVLYFTPLSLPGVTHVPTIAVRWNPKTKRYQSLDRNYEQFLGELPSLERMSVPLR